MLTVMLALPLARLAVGVNTAVRVSPVPLMALKVPPLTARSPAEPFQAKLVPGSSENVTLLSADRPALSTAKLLLILTVGAMVSMAMLGETPALPALPAVSV